MSDDSQTSIRLANNRFGENISDGFRLFTKNWTTLIVPFAVFYVISLILKIFLFTDITWQINSMSTTVNSILDKINLDPTSITDADINLMLQYLVISYSALIIQFIVGGIFTILSMYTVSNYLIKKYTGADTRFGEEFKNSFNKGILLSSLILGIGVPIGFLFIFIPGIIIFGFYIFVIFTFHQNIEKPMKEARALSKGAFWKIFGTFFLVSIIIGAINIFYQLIIDFTIPYNPSWYAPSTRNYGMIIFYELIYGLINVLLTPLFICLMTPLYVSQKAKKDLGLTRLRYGRTPSEISYTESYQEPGFQKRTIGSEDEMYCPYCGNLMKKRLNFCPSCGESMDFET